MSREYDSSAGPRLSTDTRFVDADIAEAELEVYALTILAHPNPRRVGEIVNLPELISGETVELSRLEPTFTRVSGEAPQPLADPHISRKPLILSPGKAQGEVLIHREASPTPMVIDGEPLTTSRLLDETAINRGTTLELGPHVAVLLHRQPPLILRPPRFGLVGDSGPMIRLRREIKIAADLDTPLLLRGASGTGKELVARAVHDASRRAERPWVTVNMAAIPPTLAAAELFGAKRGAYTGADRAKPGFFAAADGGTLFLDEIGDTPLEVQPLLLRALESGEIQPVGSARTRRVDVRVIAATDADLEGGIDAGKFRAPLLHRLAGWGIHLPSLAERRSDVGRLLVYFLRMELRELEREDLVMSPEGPWAAAPLVARLARYGWPGNVRELRNVARRLAITHHADPGASLDAAIESLLPPLSVKAPPLESPPSDPTQTARPQTSPPPPGRWRPVYRKADEVSKEELVETLRAKKWDLKPTAEALGVSRAVLYKLIDACPSVRIAAQLGRDEIEDVLSRHRGDITAAAAALEVSEQGLKLRLKTLGLR